MTFNALWIRIVSRNPQMSNQDTKMTISVGELKRQLQRAYEAGRNDGIDIAQDETGNRPLRQASSLFDTIFGSRQ